jgi:hypothetical protein
MALGNRASGARSGGAHGGRDTERDHPGRARVSVSKTLLSAIELGVFTELAASPADLADLRARLGLHARSAHDFLDALVAIAFWSESGGPTATPRRPIFFLDRGKPSYIGGLLEMANRRLYASGTT